MVLETFIDRTLLTKNNINEFKKSVSDLNLIINRDSLPDSNMREEANLFLDNHRKELLVP